MLLVRFTLIVIIIQKILICITNTPRKKLLFPENIQKYLVHLFFSEQFNTCGYEIANKF